VGFGFEDCLVDTFLDQSKKFKRLMDDNPGELNSGVFFFQNECCAWSAKIVDICVVFERITQGE
jgi:hypothetical protein